MATIYIETHGCQMNEADSNDVAARAAASGYAVVERPEDANVLVLNTCTVRDNAERRAYGRIHHFKELMSADASVRLVVMGCLAEQDRDRMKNNAPHIDAVFGTKEIAELGDTLSAWRDDFTDTEYSEERALLMPLGGTADAVTDAYTHLRDFVTVQRGCSYYCTFCIVPHVRGRFDHRPSAEILSEVRAKVHAGAREIMLVGQTVNAWRDPATGQDFASLCRDVAAVDGLERITFISPHPKDFTEAMIAEFSRIPKLAPRIHLPLQSGSDAMLRRMNRKYTRAQFQERLDWIATYLPHWAVTTDIIVGFPGETDDDFEATMEFVRSGVFANAYMFIYSIRRGTPAARWEQVDEVVKHERFVKLTDAQNAHVRAYNDRLIGRTVRGLIVGPSKKDRSKLTMKSGDNVTMIAPMPPEYDEQRYAREPWLDMIVDDARVWGCTGRIVRQAEHLEDEGVRVSAPMISLV